MTMATKTSALEKTVQAAWDDRASLTADTQGEYRDAVETAIMALDSGKMRVAEKTGNNDWVVHQWLKKSCPARLSSKCQWPYERQC